MNCSQSRYSNLRISKPCIPLLVFALLILHAWYSLISAAGTPANSEAQINPNQVHILAIGCCVPWLDASFCGRTTNDFVRALAKKMGIPQDNVKMVLDEQATYQGVLEGFRWLEERTGDRDTAIIFYLGHGRQLKDMGGDEADGLDEVFWLWSEKMPKSQWYAVNNRICIKDDEFSALVHRVPAGRKIVIVDSCQAGTVVEPMPRAGDKTKIAVITGAADGVDSKMVPEKKDSVFVRALIDAIEGGATDLARAFTIAEERTIRETQESCRERKRRSPGKKCKTQVPQMTDPHGVCRKMRLYR
jgi:hypothetical protein